jgi:hypothetical protein
MNQRHVANKNVSTLDPFENLVHDLRTARQATRCVLNFYSAAELSFQILSGDVATKLFPQSEVVAGIRSSVRDTAPSRGKPVPAKRASRARVAYPHWHNGGDGRADCEDSGEECRYCRFKSGILTATEPSQ